MIEMLQQSLTRILLTLVVRLIITGQPRDGNSTDSGKMGQHHGKSFMVSIIVIMLRLSIMISHKTLTMNQYSTSGWDIPSISVTTSSLLYRNDRSVI